MPACFRIIIYTLAIAAIGAGCATSDASEQGTESQGVEILAPENGASITGTTTFEIDTSGVVDDVSGDGFWVVSGGCVSVGESIPDSGLTAYPVPDGADTFQLDLATGVHELCLQYGDPSGETLYGVDEITIGVVAEDAS